MKAIPSITAVLLGLALPVAGAEEPAAAAHLRKVVVPERAATRNDGASPAAGSTTRVYLSDDAVLGAGDTALGQSAIPPLAPGQGQLRTLAVSIPAVAPGQYYLIAAADDDLAVAESDEANNTATSRIHVKRDRP